MFSPRSFFPQLLAKVFAAKPLEPLWKWAEKYVFLTRKMSTRPGFYSSDETPWTRLLQEIIQNAVDPRTGERVNQITQMKCSVAGFTEACLNGIRYKVKHDPCNIIYAIDSAKEAEQINTQRLQPTLTALGEDVFTDSDDDVGKFMLRLLHCNIWFFGSYSSGAFANKMAELAIADELEEHGQESGDTSTVENIRSRVKSSPRALLILLSKPKLAGGPIHTEYQDGTMEEWEVPCPHCGTYQMLEQDNMKFAHCKDLLGQWDKTRVLKETYFLCVSKECQSSPAKGYITEDWKRWMNDQARWRATNPNPTPGHISQHISDFYSYHESVSWGQLALKYIKSQGNFVTRQGYRNHHEGLPWEQRETKTDSEAILALRKPYKRGYIPHTPVQIILAGDIGLHDAHWEIWAFQRDGTPWLIDWGTELHPSDLVTIVRDRKYPCADGNSYNVTCGFCDAKYRKPEVEQACLRLPQRMYPTVGISADLAIRSIAFNHVPHRPKWFGHISYIDRDAKNELYIQRIGERRAPGLNMPEDIDEEIISQHCNEALIDLSTGDGVKQVHSAKQFQWTRTGANHKGDCSKIVLVAWRYLTDGDPEMNTREAPQVPEPAEAPAI